MNEVNPAWKTAPYEAAWCAWYPSWMLKLPRKRRRHQMRIHLRGVIRGVIVPKVFQVNVWKKFDKVWWNGESKT